MIPLQQPDSRATRLPNGKEGLRVHKTYFYIWEMGGVIRRFKVEEGFEYDGASVPRLLWSVTGIERRGLQDAAALVHDVFYKHKGKLPAGIIEVLLNVSILPDVGSLSPEEYVSLVNSLGCWVNDPQPWSRAAADRFFCRLLREAGVSMLKRRLMYRAVRCFGWIFWPEGSLKDLGRWLLGLAKWYLWNRYVKRS